MSIIKSSGPSLPPYPDDLTLPQFMLDYHHPLRQSRTGSNEANQRPWFIDDVTGRSYTMEEVRTRVFGWANGIANRYNIKDEDVVCIYSQNHIDYPVVIWGSQRIGAIVSGANPAYTVSELQYQLEEIKASILVVDSNTIETALKAAQLVGLSRDRIIVFDVLESTTPPTHGFPTVNQVVQEGILLNHPPKFTEKQLGPGGSRKKIAFLCFSSGTTGKPKAVAVSHFSVISNAIQVAVWEHIGDPTMSAEQMRFHPGDVGTAVLPLYHIYGLIINLHLNIFAGCTVVMFSKFGWPNFLDSVVRHKITHLFIVPPMAVLFAKHPATKQYDLSGVKAAWFAAAPLSPELQQQFQAVLPNCFVGQGYGMTETATVVSLPPFGLRSSILGSAGALLPGTEAKVVLPDGSIAPIGKEGELYVRGPQCTNHYLNNPSANAETFVDDWVRTGDEVYFNEAGHVYIVDRLKELIKCRGFQVPPAELEGHLLDHPDVADVCVIGIPDDYSGEVPLAYVVLAAPAAQKVKQNVAAVKALKDSIIKHVSDHKVRYKWLEGGVEFIEAIPKNPSGKLLRRVLRDQAKLMIASRNRKEGARGRL